MTSGRQTTSRDFIYVLRLLRQSKRTGSMLKRADIPRLSHLSRDAVRAIIDQAAIHWLDDLESAQRMDELINRGI